MTAAEEDPRGDPVSAARKDLNEDVEALVQCDGGPHKLEKVPDGFHPSQLTDSTCRSTTSLSDATSHDGNADLSENEPREARDAKEPREARAVRFLDVEVREYGRSPSRNPGGNDGVPLELSWEYIAVGRTEVDAFEEGRSSKRLPDYQRRGRLPRLQRERMLRDFGFTKKEIQAASKRAALARGRRRRSTAIMPHDRLYEWIDNRIGALRRRVRRRWRRSRR